MVPRPALVLILACTLLSACASIVRPNFTQELTELRSGAYSLDPEHAYINFRVDHFDLSKIIGRFNVASGTLDFDPDNIESMVLQGIIDASSVDVNNEDLENRLRGKAWFNSDAFPQIVFTSTSVAQGENDELLIKGELSMRGVTRELIVTANFNGGADNILTGKYTLGFTANTVFKRSDFGMDAFAALIGDEIAIELHGEFQRN